MEMQEEAEGVDYEGEEDYEVVSVGHFLVESAQLEISAHLKKSAQLEGPKQSCIEWLVSCLCGSGDDDELQPTVPQSPTPGDDNFCELCNENKKCVRLLLLGTGESGKSTFVKQFKILETAGFSNMERRERIEDIRSNLKVAIVTIILAMRELGIAETQLENSALEAEVEYMCNVASTDLNQPYPQEFYDKAEALWADDGVKRCAEYGYAYQLLDCAKYFLDNIDRIRQNDYLPTEQDLIWCRIRTTGIIQTTYTKDNTTFHIFDVGGQIAERSAWIATFYQCTAVMFVADASSYDMSMREKPERNRLDETLDTFDQIWNNRYLRDKSIILFLNKEDLLISKVTSQLSSITDFFPDYEDFDIEHVRGPEFQAIARRTEEPQVRKAKAYVLNKFKEVYAGPRARSGHRCYPHFTTAVDTENVRRVYRDCDSIIKTSLLAQYGL